MPFNDRLPNIQKLFRQFDFVPNSSFLKRIIETELSTAPKGSDIRAELASIMGLIITEASNFFEKLNQTTEPLSTTYPQRCVNEFILFLLKTQLNPMFWTITMETGTYDFDVECSSDHPDKMVKYGYYDVEYYRNVVYQKLAITVRKNNQTIMVFRYYLENIEQLPADVSLYILCFLARSM